MVTLIVCIYIIIHYTLYIHILYSRARDFCTITVNSLFPECSFEWTVLSVALNRFSIAINLKNNNWTAATRQTGFFLAHFIIDGTILCVQKYFFISFPQQSQILLYRTSEGEKNPDEKIKHHWNTVMVIQGPSTFRMSKRTNKFIFVVEMVWKKNESRADDKKLCQRKK